MKKTSYIVIGTSIIAIAIAIAAIFKMMSVGEESAPASGPTGNVFPVTVTSEISQGNTKQLATDTGGVVAARDFLKDADTVSDMVNPGHYYLGNYIDPENPSETTFPYVIEYVESTNSFTIGLFTEPLGMVRKQAEQYLMARLNVTQADMCRLRYTVSVPNRVSTFYAGMSLGFSFCPDSVMLPE